MQSAKNYFPTKLEKKNQINSKSHTSIKNALIMADSWFAPLVSKMSLEAFLSRFVFFFFSPTSRSGSGELSFLLLLLLLLLLLHTF